MREKIFGILVVLIVLISSIYILTGCSSISDEKKDKEELTLEVLEKKADVTILGPHMGADCIEYTNYYICYNESKVYEYKYFKATPMQDSNHYKEYEPDIKITEHTIDQNDINEVKSVVDNLKEDTKKSIYKIKVNGKEYNVDDVKIVTDLIDKMKDE